MDFIRCELLVYTDRNVHDNEEEQQQQKRERDIILYNRDYKTRIQMTIPTTMNEMNSLSCDSGYKFDPKSRLCVGEMLCNIQKKYIYYKLLRYI